MKKTRFTETQIIKAIHWHGGRDIKDISRKLGVTAAAFTTGVRNTLASAICPIKQLHLF